MPEKKPAYDPDEALKLDNQLCFPLYVTAKEIVKRYTPFLDEIGLTYTQYIAMMVLWEKEPLTIKELGKCLMLDSGTLTPLLKKMESRGLIVRERSTRDERMVVVSLTDKGRALKEPAGEVPLKMAKCVNLSYDEAMQLRTLLRKALGKADTTEVR